MPKSALAWTLVAILVLGAGSVAFIVVLTPDARAVPSGATAPREVERLALQAAPAPAAVPMPVLAPDAARAAAPAGARPLSSAMPAAPATAPVSADAGSDRRLDPADDPDARSQAALELRTRRFSDSMDRLNRRNAERLGLPAPPPGSATQARVP